MAEEERLNGVLSPCGHDHKAMGAHVRRQWLRLCAQLLSILPVPLRVHGRHREGVLAHQPSATDLLFITLRLPGRRPACRRHQSEALFSPSTRYRDLALGPSLFHWESQSTTTASSATGQRYIHHESRGSRVLLFVREQRRQGTVTEPFVCLGFARDESHEGERPMAIRWRLEREIPAMWIPVMALAV